MTDAADQVTHVVSSQSRAEPAEESGGQVDVSVIVVSYNAFTWLPRCLASVEDGAAGLRVETVVVDNASDEPVREWLAAQGERIRLVQLGSNVGFARACNIGAGYSRGRYVMLLNPDAVLEPGAIRSLLSFLEGEPRRGIVGGRTLRPDGSLDPSSCWASPSLWSWFCSAVGLTAALRGNRLFDPESMGAWRRDTVREVDIVTGCLLLTSIGTWQLLGGFDDDFFMYGEDADLSMRARAAGLRPSITPDAVAVHAVGASSSGRLGKQRLLLRGKATLARKQWSPAKAWLGVRLLMAGVALRALAQRVGRREGPWRQLWAERAELMAGWPPRSH